MILNILMNYFLYYIEALHYFNKMLFSLTGTIRNVKDCTKKKINVSYVV